MAKIKSKGTSLLMSIATVYTAVPQLTSLTVSGEKSMKYDSTVLSGGTFKTYDPTGYTEPSSISAGVFWDPADTVHVAFRALIATPVATNFKITYADTAPTSEIYSGTSFGMDKDVQKDNAVTATLTIETSGAPS
jgi:hypothetical protein